MDGLVQAALRHPRHAGAGPGGQERIARLHPPDQLGRRRSGRPGACGDRRGAAGISWAAGSDNKIKRRTTMRVILSFIIGVLVGAGGLFAWLHQMPHEQTQTADARTGSLPPPAPGPTLDGQLPPAPRIMPDLTELDLPLRPAIGDSS